jgi:hypothetical protein
MNLGTNRAHPSGMTRVPQGANVAPGHDYHGKCGGDPIPTLLAGGF